MDREALWMVVHQSEAPCHKSSLPFSDAALHPLCRSADVDRNSVIDFNEFLRLFHTQLLDLPRLLRYIKMKPLVSPFV
jgi:hypothetical protein